MELIGDAGLVFDVTAAADLARRLAWVLNDPGRARELGDLALVHARRFRWDETADKVFNVLTRSHTPSGAYR
jgi:glycosyltransferase involved in cell wall biosynthesis